MRCGEKRKNGKEDYKYIQVTCTCVEHIYHTNCCLALSVGQVEHLCSGSISL